MKINAEQQKKEIALGLFFLYVLIPFSKEITPRIGIVIEFELEILITPNNEITDIIITIHDKTIITTLNILSANELFPQLSLIFPI